MLVPTSFQPITSEESVYMGVTVMGGVVSQFAQALVQMSHCKFLGFANYTIAKPTQSPAFTNVYFFTNWSGLPKGLNKTNKYYSFLFGSTPLSEWIGVIFQYVATKESSTNSPIITFRVKKINRQHAYKFLAVSLSGLLISEGLIFALEKTTSNSQVTMGIVVLTLPIYTFVLSKFWVYRN